MTSQEQENEDLRKAAYRGDVKFLRDSCVVYNKPHGYYLTVFQSNRYEYLPAGNIFHIGASANQVEFIREAIKLLASEVVQELIQTVNQDMENPLHCAAIRGNVEVIKMLLEIFPSQSLIRPWLDKDITGSTPCHRALTYGHEHCASEFLKKDKELLNMIDNLGISLLFRAASRRCNKVVLEILKSDHSFSTDGPDGQNAMEYLPRCSDDKEICRLFLIKKPELIYTKGFSILNTWAAEGKVWPFEHLLMCDDIIPNVKMVVFNIFLTKDPESGYNLLHTLALSSSIKESIQIAKLLMDVYKDETSNKEITTHASTTSSITRDQQSLFPWLLVSKSRITPLLAAIYSGNEDFASYILSLDNKAVIQSPFNCLHVVTMAANPKSAYRPEKNKLERFALEILEVLIKEGWTHLIIDGDEVVTMHNAPFCGELFLERLVAVFPELLEKVSKAGETVLHSWVKEVGKEWPFKCIFESENIDQKWRSRLVKLMFMYNYNQNNPFHVAATCSHKETLQIVKFLVEAYKKEVPDYFRYDSFMLPWLRYNSKREGSLHLAIKNKQDELAKYIVSQLGDNNMGEIIDFYTPEHETLLLAVQNDCFQVTKYMMENLDKECWNKHIKSSVDGRNILHIASRCKDTELGTWLIDQTPEFITEPDNEENTPLDEAFAFGATWFIEHILKKFASKFDSATLSWVKACEQGKYETLVSFILQYPGDFRNLCIQKKISPLHHINKLRSLKEYESFVTISDMKGLINLQDSEKNTPLHKAIEKQNIHLAEALLGLEKTNYTIKNKEGKSAMDMLADKCNSEDLRWDEMCQRIGINPRINTSFFQQRTDLLEVRNSLFVVAALIATITFAAGFTLPGGLNQDTGEAMMVKKAAFLVFLMANTLGMCTSTLVLICLIWSLVQDKSSEVPLLLIEKSMYLLMLAICSTLLAFMTGVFVTISPQTLWPTIVVIVMSSFIAVLVERNLLQKVLRIRPTKQGGVREHQEHEIFRGVSIVDACSAFIKQFQFRRTRKNEEHEETPNLV
ncbi:hypothetical protein BVRB_3g064420 [Beta vulgaris subsp. vulgaris]|nr:hypothetical protein BVRB_3g064420 [Beta vulgaris subsp. vulgaris]